MGQAISPSIFYTAALHQAWSMGRNGQEPDGLAYVDGTAVAPGATKDEKNSPDDRNVYIRNGENRRIAVYVAEVPTF